MTHLILFIITAVMSTHLIRYGQARGCRMAWVGALTYVTAVACTALWVAVERTPIQSAAIGLGLSGGTALGVTYLFFNATIRRFGVGVAHFTRQLAVIVPILASLLIWHEPLNLLLGAGIVLVFVALPLMCRPLEIRPGTVKAWPILLPTALLASGGATGTLFKAYAVRNIIGGQPPYLLFLFGAAAATVTCIAIATGEWPDGKDILHGIILGLVNVLLNYFRVRGLETELGVRAFPTMSIGVILLSAAVAAILWKERYRGRVFVGMVVAIIALVLINLRQTG